jgi:hypothetical protein
VSNAPSGVRIEERRVLPPARVTLGRGSTITTAGTGGYSSGKMLKIGSLDEEHEKVNRTIKMIKEPVDRIDR